MTSGRATAAGTATAAALTATLTATLGLAAVCWVLAVRQMTGMDMGVETSLGSFAFFVAQQLSRRRCRESAGSGFGFGLYCVGSSIGLILVLVVLGVMSIPWMAAVAVVVVAQKLLPEKAAVDVPLALAIVALESGSSPGPRRCPG